MRITEHQAVDELVVYGYLRGAAAPSGRLRALSSALKAYCEQHELTLSRVFTEWIDDADGSVFSSLLATLSTQQPYGVVLLSRHHLGPRDVANSRAAQITTSGTRLIAVR
ncbi:hypothetical protein [Catenulispora yoronensis]|uniref:hypothetical protein n=1 Tax=Catenulispora yoronensis TaxID=450799 RepID=UPI0031D00081